MFVLSDYFLVTVFRGFWFFYLIFIIKHMLFMEWWTFYNINTMQLDGVRECQCQCHFVSHQKKKESHFVSSKESFYFSLAILEPSVICEEILTQISSSYSLRPLVGGSPSSFVANLSVAPRKKLKLLKISILPWTIMG